MKPLQQLTFEDLVALVEKRLTGARSPAKIEGWQRLLGVARALAGSGDAVDDLAVGRRWWLARVRVVGYQGVGVPLDVELDSSPGVTVVHGPNGSGKSSLADAVDTALLGCPRSPAASGGGGQLPLWERVHCGRDVTRGHVQLTLCSGRERLVLTTGVDRRGYVVERTVVHDGPDGRAEVDLGSMTWGSALAGYRPVFGYAAVERQVQRARNLQEFLEPLLAFGGCVDRLQEQVRAASEAATAARQRFNDALDAARTEIDRVDRERHRDGAPDLPDLCWPDIADDREGWLAAAGLSDEGAAVPEVVVTADDVLQEAVARAEGALVAVDEAQTSLPARLAGPLRDLHVHGAALDEAGTTCPVCATVPVPWLSTLGAALTDLLDVDRAQKQFGVMLAELLGTATRIVDPIRAVLATGWCVPPIVEGAQPALSAVAALREAVDREGHRAVPAVRAALGRAADLLGSADWRAAVVEAAGQSDHQRQWARARRAAVEPFLVCWAAAVGDGAEAAGWQSAAGCLRDLQNDLRRDRACELRGLTDQAVRRLLADVGLTVTDLSVQGTKAGVVIHDEQGRPVELGMLSAGQRNALLLAPLLAVAHGGPFAFLVLDDPVHAFDQIRVDRLAALIVTLAARQRVVVLTHDDRLAEQLLARSPDHDQRTVRRAAGNGEVVVESTRGLWDILLTDADAALSRIPKAERTAVAPVDVVRGFCRMAVDEALRRFLVRRAVHDARDQEADVATLDEAGTTKDRLAAVERLHPDDPDLAAARPLLEPHLDDWNRAAHGNPPQSAVTGTEIAHARAACRALVGVG